MMQRGSQICSFVCLCICVCVCVPRTHAQDCTGTEATGASPQCHVQSQADCSQTFYQLGQGLSMQCGLVSTHCLSVGICTAAAKTFVEEPGVCVCQGQSAGNHAGNVCKYEAPADKCKQDCEAGIGATPCLGYWHGGGDWCHLVAQEDAETACKALSYAQIYYQKPYDSFSNDCTLAYESQRPDYADNAETAFTCAILK